MLAFQGYLIGDLRLRQARIHDEKCPKAVRDYVHQHDCELTYNMRIEDEGDYTLGWRKVNQSGRRPFKRMVIMVTHHMVVRHDATAL